MSRKKAQLNRVAQATGEHRTFAGDGVGRGGPPVELERECVEHLAHQALDLYQAASHRPGQALALNTVGWYHAQLGDHWQTLTYYQQALTLLQELDDRHGQANVWDSLGYAHHHLGHHDQAINCYQQALDLVRDLGARYNEANILTHLGDTRHTTGNSQAAHDAWQQALTILDQLDHPDAAAVRVKLRYPDQTRPEDERDYRNL